MAPVEKCSALGIQQRHQVFSNHRRTGDGPGHRPIELAAAGSTAASLLNAFAAHAHPISQAQLQGHGPDRFHLATHGIHQGELGLGQGNGHGQSGKASTGTDVDQVQGLLWRTLQQGNQGPEAVEHLGNPVVVTFNQAGEVEATVPGAELLLQGYEQPLLDGRGGPAELLPEGEVIMGHPLRRQR